MSGWRKDTTWASREEIESSELIYSTNGFKWHIFVTNVCWLVGNWHTLQT